MKLRILGLPSLVAPCVPLVLLCSLGLVAGCGSQTDGDGETEHDGAIVGDGSPSDAGLGRQADQAEPADQATTDDAAPIDSPLDVARPEVAEDSGPMTMPDVVAYADGPSPVADAPSPVADGPSSVADAPSSEPIGIAIVSSDHVTTALSLANADGTAVTQNECLHSASSSPKLVSPLSGAVTLPTAPQPDHEIALVDQANDTITWVSSTCEVLRQLDVGAGFAANPQDVIAGLPDDKAYVPRYGINAGNAAEGSDILVIKPKTATIVGRIDLRAWVSTTPTPAQPYLPFPGRGLYFGGKVYVPLGSLSAARDRAGLGRLLEIDPASDTVVRAIDIPEKQNCVGVRVAASAASTPQLLVTCQGGYYDVTAPTGALGTSDFNFGYGIELVDLSTTPAQVSELFRWATSAKESISNAQRMGSEVVFVFEKDPSDYYDVVAEFPLGGSTLHSFFQSLGLRTLSVEFDAARQRLYVLDAATPQNGPPERGPRIRVFDTKVSNNPTEVGTLATYPLTGRLPRRLGFF